MVLVWEHIYICVAARKKKTFTVILLMRGSRFIDKGFKMGRGRGGGLIDSGVWD